MINSIIPTYGNNTNQDTVLKNISSNFERSQMQSTSNLVGTYAQSYSVNAIPIMVSPDIGNATSNGTSPVAKSRFNTQPSEVYCVKGNPTDESGPGRNTCIYHISIYSISIYTLTYQKYSYGPKFPFTFSHINLLIKESTL